MAMNAHDLALKYLSTRDRTVSEIRKHLLSKDVPKAEIEECLEYLSECGLVDDEDYCERYILYGKEKGRGPIRLEKELTERGVPSDIIKMGMEAHFGAEGEREAALLHVQKLLRNRLEESEYPEDSVFYEENQKPSPLSEKELARIGRRLASQGFHSHVIYEILGMLRR